MGGSPREAPEDCWGENEGCPERRTSKRRLKEKLELALQRHGDGGRWRCPKLEERGSECLVGESGHWEGLLCGS